MKKSTEIIKKDLSENFNISQKSIKRVSKSKNFKNEIVRIFQVDTNLFQVITNPTDDEYISLAPFVETPAVVEPEPEEDDEIYENEEDDGYLGTAQIRDYYFAVGMSTLTTFFGAPYLYVCIVPKDLWDDEQLTSDLPLRIENELHTLRIESDNETSDMVSYTIIESLQLEATLSQLGMEYNNDLARHLDGIFDQMYLKP